MTKSSASVVVDPLLVLLYSGEVIVTHAVLTGRPTPSLLTWLESIVSWTMSLTSSHS